MNDGGIRLGITCLVLVLLIVSRSVYGQADDGHDAGASGSDLETPAASEVPPAGPADDDETALAKATQNPVADLISLPFQNNTNFDYGPQDKTQNVLNIQPVIPVKLTEDWNLITRTILPVVSQPAIFPDQGRETGIGDTLFTAFFSPRNAGKWIWGVGPAVNIPTSSDDRLGFDEWGLGPSAVILTMRGPWVVGSLFSNIWDVDGDTDINFFTWQYFVNYNFDGGWYLTSAPIITANWEAPSGEKWTVPFGGGAGRVIRIGRLPVNLSAQIFYNGVEAPDVVGDWSLRLQAQLLFPKK